MLRNLSLTSPASPAARLASLSSVRTRGSSACASLLGAPANESRCVAHLTNGLADFRLTGPRSIAHTRSSAPHSLQPGEQPWLGRRSSSVSNPSAGSGRRPAWQCRVGGEEGGAAAGSEIETEGDARRSSGGGEPLEGAAASDVIVSGLIDYLNNSWTHFHATATSARMLLSAGFQHLREQEEWQLQPGGKYFFTRNGSSVVAFTMGHKCTDPSSLAIRIIAAHTDSPCLKLKPVSAVLRPSFLSVAVAPYGGGLWHTWFDRDLSVAGRVLVREEGGGGVGAVRQRLVQVQRPIMRVPTLAIHLDRNVTSDGFKPNLEAHVLPVLATGLKAQLMMSQADSKSNSKGHNGAAQGGQGSSNGSATSHGLGAHHSVLLQVLADELGCHRDAILDFELNVCDTQPSCVGGAAGEFVFSGRLDNLASCFASLQALIHASAEETLREEDGVCMVALFDNEEVGSESSAGAGSPCLLQAMSRIASACHDSSSSSNSGAAQGSAAPRPEGLLERTIRRSFLVSADMAHAVHPNYPEKHEERHGPRMHAGLVVKHNANQRYATNLVSSFLFKQMALRHGLPIQSFVVRNDMGCGSTIGPILASGIGMRTVDVGMPQLSMHSVREMCATDDVVHGYRTFLAFFSPSTSSLLRHALSMEDSLDDEYSNSTPRRND